MRFITGLRTAVTSVAIASAFLGVMATASFAEQALQTKHELFKVETKQNHQSGGKLIPVQKAMPGEEITGILSYEYQGKEEGKNVVVTIPLRPEFKYLDGSATNETMAFFSTDQGKTYQPRSTLTKVDATGNVTPAIAEDITNIQWRITKALKKGDKGKLEYKIILK